MRRTNISFKGFIIVGCLILVPVSCCIFTKVQIPLISDQQSYFWHWYSGHIPANLLDELRVPCVHAMTMILELGRSSAKCWRCSVKMLMCSLMDGVGHIVKNMHHWQTLTSLI